MSNYPAGISNADFCPTEDVTPVLTRCRRMGDDTMKTLQEIIEALTAVANAPAQDVKLSSNYDSVDATCERCGRRLFVMLHHPNKSHFCLAGCKQDAQDINAELLAALISAKDYIGTQTGLAGVLIYERLYELIARAQTPPPHEGHNASRAVREASE